MASVDVSWPSDEEEFDTVEKGSARRRPAKIDDVASQESTELKEVDTSGDDPADVPEAESAPVADNNDEALLADDEHSELQNTREPVANPENRSHGHAAAISRLLAEAVIVAIAVGFGLWAWSLHADNDNLRSEVRNLNNNPQAIIQKQSNALIGKVGALMQLPADETPTIANVSDAAAAKQQSNFFANAQNGDKVLMYAKAGQAILYRPSTDKIVLVAPLTFNNQAASTTKTNTTATSTNKAVTGNTASTGTTTTTKR